MDFKSKMICRRVWWIILFLGGGYYFFSNYKRITVNPNAIDGVITLSLLIVVFMPLVSEITVFGMSIKKEIQETKNEMKKEVASIKNEIFSFAISNRNNQQVNISYENMPTQEEVEEVKSKLKEQGKKNKEEFTKETEGEKEASSNLYEKYPVSEKQMFLYKTRYALEKKLEDITSKHGVKSGRNISTGVAILRHNKIISTSTEELILKVTSICNRGIHGEVVDDEYIEYIEAVMSDIPSVLDKEVIDKSPKMDKFTVCTRCKYAGPAYYENECPKCGFISDDD